MQAGQFFIFTARCIHGSMPNISRRQRMGFAIRVVPTHVRVYGGMTGFDEFGHHFELDRYGCVLVAGEDRYGLNRVARENTWGEPFTPGERMVPRP
jgi:chlorinating enzyme